MNTTPEIGNIVKISGMKPGYLNGAKGEVVSVRKDERCDVLLSEKASTKVRQAIQSRGKPWQEKLFRTVNGCFVIPAVPIGSLAAA